MVEITEEMGRIAFRVLVQKMANDNEIPNAQSFKRELPNEAKKLGVAPEKLTEFAKVLIPEIIATRLGCKSVALNW